MAEKHPINLLTEPSNQEDDFVQYVSSLKYFYSSEEDKYKPPLLKRRSTEGTSNDVTPKIAKKVSAEDAHKPLCKWSDQDEIALLQGMIDFKTDTVKTPGFYESVEKSISFGVTKNQVADKIRHLRKKYEAKEKNNPCFDLSKVIWGPEGVAVDTKTSKTKKQDLFFSTSNDNKVEDHTSKGGDVESSFLVKMAKALGVKDAKQKWSGVSLENKKKITEKLNLLQAKQLERKEMLDLWKTKERECVLQKTELLHQVISVITQEH